MTKIDTNDPTDSAVNCKEKGNEFYKKAQFDEALQAYTEGLKITTDDKDRLVLLKNRAAGYLKVQDFEKVIADCTSALELSPKDPKALFRRAQGYQALENYEKAYNDARMAQSGDPKNKEVHTLLADLHGRVQDMIEEKTKLGGKVSQMFDILFDNQSPDKEKRETAANNLVALAKEKAGAQLLISRGILQRIVPFMKNEKTIEIRLAFSRLVSEYCKEILSCKMILKELGLPWLMNLMDSSNQDQVNVAQYIFQTILSVLSGSDCKTEKKAEYILLEQNKKEIDSTMSHLTVNITARAISGICRDAIIELICRNIDYKILDWGKKFITIGGLQKLLQVASELKEYHYESCIGITENTKVITSICLGKVYDSQFDEKEKTLFVEQVDMFMKEHLLNPEVECKVRATVALTCLLLGPLDVGNTFVGREGILEMLLTMANTDDELQQKISCECLIAAASKKDKCQAIISMGTDILKKLFQSESQDVKVRALVGLCKLGSFGGSDATKKPFKDGAQLKLAEACRRFLVNPSKDREMRRWACEGLSYLTLDAEVKEKLCEDKIALRSMIEMAKTGDLNCLYGVVTTLVNICNAYDKQEIIPEMVELAKFSKQHVPEEHELDDKDFIDKRVNILCNEGVTTALIALSKTDSQNSRELIARIFNAICEQQNLRGKVVQQGGTKALLSMAHEGTPNGKTVASQALARIGISIDPEVAFPGQRTYEVVRPLLHLLSMEGKALENFEGLMALCNIASISESARQRILKEKGLAAIEHYMFEHHDLIRKAAFQCMTNMCSSPSVIEIIEGANDKFKYLFLCTSDEDVDIIKAAAGSCCILMSSSEKIVPKIFEAKDWQEILQFLLSHPDKDIQHRGTLMVRCLVYHSKEFARTVIETHCKEALTAMSKIENPEFVNPQAREYSREIIEKCVDLKLIDDPNQKDD